MLARSPLFENFSLQRNFQGLLSIVQLSRFLSFFLCDSFDILSNLFRFVKNFFILLFCPLRFPLGPLQATACIDYHISSALSTTFFHLFFQRFQLRFSAPALRSFRLRVSGSASVLRSQGAVLSDRCYLITSKRNCQCFFYFLFISDNSHNSDIISLFVKYTYILYLKGSLAYICN